MAWKKRSKKPRTKVKNAKKVHMTVKNLNLI